NARARGTRGQTGIARVCPRRIDGGGASVLRFSADGRRLSSVLESRHPFFARRFPIVTDVHSLSRDQIGKFPARGVVRLGPGFRWFCFELLPHGVRGGGGPACR